MVLGIKSPRRIWLVEIFALDLGVSNGQFPPARPTGNFYQNGYFNKDTY